MKEKILVLMKQYNELVIRYHKAEEFFKDESLSISTREKQAKNYQQLVTEMDAIDKQINENGYRMSKEERLTGFRQVAYFESLGGIT